MKSRTKTLYEMFIAIFLLTASGCDGWRRDELSPSLPSSEVEPVQQWAVHESQRHGFAVEYPAKWRTFVGEIRENGILFDDVALAARAPVDAQGMPPADFSIYELPGRIDLSSALEARQLTMKLKGTQIDQAMLTEDGGQPRTHLSYK